MLYFIGLGLADEKDITVRGLEIVKKCDRVFLEAYTSCLGIDHAKLEEFYGREVILADRDMVESESEQILRDAKEKDVAFLVVGDAFCATTHSDMAVRAADEGIKFRVIHNASIMDAIGVSGLQLYRCGQTVSIVFFTPTWRPDSFYPKVAQNFSSDLHTLCLLDIKMKEQSEENILKGRKIYEPPRFMSVNLAISQLLEIAEKQDKPAYTGETKAIGFARVGAADERIVFGTLDELYDVDFGKPLHSLVLCASLHPIEEEMLALYHVSKYSDDIRLGAKKEREEHARRQADDDEASDDSEAAAALSDSILTMRMG